MKTFFYTLCAAALLSTLSCDSRNNNEEVCESAKLAFVTEADPVAVGNVNTDIPITIKFQTDSNCGNFSKFYENGTGNKTVSVEAKYVGCNCATSPVIRTVIYKFKASTAGNYTVSFTAGNNAFITTDVTVN